MVQHVPIDQSQCVAPQDFHVSRGVGWISFFFRVQTGTSTHFQFAQICSVVQHTEKSLQGPPQGCQLTETSERRIPSQHQPVSDCCSGTARNVQRKGRRCSRQQLLLPHARRPSFRIHANPKKNASGQRDHTTPEIGQAELPHMFQKNKTLPSKRSSETEKRNATL